LHKPLVFELDEGFTNEGNTGAELLRDLAFDD
jgi:hypothetical protein